VFEAFRNMVILETLFVLFQSSVGAQYPAAGEEQSPLVVGCITLSDI
jgi:hypothetical protein